MSSLPANTTVRVEGLSKRYRIGHTAPQDESLAANLVRAVASPIRNIRHLRSLSRFSDEAADDVLLALDDVTFELHHGDVLGIVGRNGAGKSTLLKILARITEPSRGTAQLRGRVSSLLEVGTGFHPDLTGRENVFLNGTMLGMTRREVHERLDEIVAFAEVERFLDTPVKRYSSGMYVRLAFAVAAHLEPDVLIADEVLAVGDAAFQRKCIGEMRSVASRGRTVIFVSHNPSVVSSLCTRAIWLDQGRLRLDGRVDDVLEAYAGDFESDASGIADRTDRLGSGAVRLTGLAVHVGGEPSLVVTSGEPLEIQLTCAVADRPPEHLVASVILESSLREPIAVFSNGLTGEEIGLGPGGGALVCAIPGLPLNDGDYVLSVRLEVDGVDADYIGDVARFHVTTDGVFAARSFPGMRTGAVIVRHSWSSL